MAKKPAQTNALSELKTALKNKDLGRLYFFHGEETFLLHHYLGQMKKQLLDPNGGDDPAACPDGACKFSGNPGGLCPKEPAAVPGYGRNSDFCTNFSRKQQ